MLVTIGKILLKISAKKRLLKVAILVGKEIMLAMKDIKENMAVNQGSGNQYRKHREIKHKRPVKTDITEKNSQNAQNPQSLVTALESRKRHPAFILRDGKIKPEQHREKE